MTLRWSAGFVCGLLSGLGMAVVPEFLLFLGAAALGLTVVLSVAVEVRAINVFRLGQALQRAEQKCRQYRDVWLERGFPVTEDDRPDLEATVVALNTRNLLLAAKLRGAERALELAKGEGTRGGQNEEVEAR